MGPFGAPRSVADGLISYTAWAILPDMPPHPPQPFGAVVAAPFGGVGIRVADGLVVELVYLPDALTRPGAHDRLAARAARQVERYLADPDFRFDLPLAPVGSRYQQRVWEAIRAIPRGQVRSYGALAQLLRSAPRAVGQACGANWYPLIIPCHRVVAAHGMGGFAGTDESAGGQSYALKAKRWLLLHEGVALPE